MPPENFSIELPFGPPPILPDLGKNIEKYLTKLEKLPIHNGKTNFAFWRREINTKSLYHTELSPSITTLKVNRDLISDEYSEFNEVCINGIGQTTNNSTSFSRPPDKISDDVRGCRTNVPFWPGGFDPPIFLETNYDFDIDHTELLHVAPGLSRGLDFSDKRKKVPEIFKNFDEFLEVLNFENVIKDFGLTSVSSAQLTNDTNRTKSLEHQLEIKIVPEEVKMPVLKISAASTSAKSIIKTEWAELLDSTQTVVDFHEKINDPAVKYGFELDTFQKLAVLKLEEHKHIFVSAHTSAGKTVVAEYAIGLSQKHCTKTVYTSPIKALSNQKYRDFKNKFTDVGLITGDFQVNQQASCLIMTTEILRSMLYVGSDVIRDLEFVIFDEVHYINDSERGHVWEEILIMLPDTVCIVMLSATVPNVLEFADWIGSIKRAKMFVVSTLKRPVPLQHYLYTGLEDKAENLFLIMETEGIFIKNGYDKALATIQKPKPDIKGDKAKGDKAKDDKAKSDKAKNDKGKAMVLMQPLKSTSEKQYLISFVRYLNKHDKLPAVAFTFSRNKCDRNAELLMSIDLTTQSEKDYIKHYFVKCIRTLKPDDRNLPQILKMQSLLCKGIAVHHSGILPILKEIVEILFQGGLVKFLFATETFAMGVNMPAKTVAFDSIKKYDGSGTRYLQPAEYIQMAGRAGRRGQDETGTVIILCKHALEDAEHLKNMLTGPPTRLESQFRMTYSMILNLLRVKGMRVEDIMCHSFKELHSRRKLKSYQEELAELKKEDNHDDFKSKPIYKKLEIFYNTASDFIHTADMYVETIFNNPKIQKELVPGRFIIISHVEHINKLALILKIIPKRNYLEYKVLTLSNSNGENCKHCELFYRMISLTAKTVYVPEEKLMDILLAITAKSIVTITKFHLKIDVDLILKDWDKRQIPRFKNDPPSQTCLRAINELSERSHDIYMKGGLAESSSLSLNNIKINNLNMVEMIKEITKKRKKAESFDLYNEIPDFESQFKEVFFIKQKEERKNHLEYLLSYESLLLYPDYQSKIKILRTLKYINDEDIVETKGQIACQMGSNELILTELIFQNCLSKYEPAEIAALLSSLVFQVKMDDNMEPKLTDKLKQGIKMIEEVHSYIKSVESEVAYDSINLNFGLVEVVYEWAHGKPFAEIMNLIKGQVQEGIIIRCIQQLNEILRDIRDATKSLGDSLLKKKMEEASDAIKRDIVFAASLYTQ